MEGVEETLVVVFTWVRVTIEVLAALVVIAGVVVVIGHYVQARRDRHPRGADSRYLRLVLSQYLAMALELLLAADILATSLAPSWTELGELAVVAVIRTALNYFLEREMREMEAQGQEPPRRPWGLARGPQVEPIESADPEEFGDGRSPA